MTLDRILVAVSFSERSIEAVRKAARLAVERASNITLLHVVEPVKRRSIRRLPAQQTLLRARVINARKELARYAGEIAARDRIAVDIRIEIGEKVSSIVRACKDADVLLIGGTSMGGLMAAFHMSSAERLIGKCGIPVLVVNGSVVHRHERALVAVDGSYQSSAAVGAAARLWPDAQLTLLHAMDGRQERLMRIHEVPLWTVGDRHSLRTIKGHAYLSALAARARVSTKGMAFRLAYGEPWRAVLEVQDELDADVVVAELVQQPPLATLAALLGGEELEHHPAQRHQAGVRAVAGVRNPPVQGEPDPVPEVLDRGFVAVHDRVDVVRMDQLPLVSHDRSLVRR